MAFREKISRLLTSLIDIDYLNEKIRNRELIEMQKSCIIGKSTKLYNGSSIVNLQKNKSLIELKDNVHCRGQLLIFSYAGKIQIGNNVFIGEGTKIWSGSEVGIKIGNDVLISHNVFIGDTNSHEIDYLQRASSFIEMTTQGHPKINPGVETKPVVIEDNVWLSFNVIVMKGVTIGKGSIIGSGSIITKDIPPFSLVVGNPARILKSLINKE